MNTFSPKLKIYCHEKCKVNNKQCDECAGLEYQYFKFKFDIAKNSARDGVKFSEDRLIGAFANQLESRKIYGKVLVYE